MRITGLERTVQRSGNGSDAKLLPPGKRVGMSVSFRSEMPHSRGDDRKKEEVRTDTGSLSTHANANFSPVASHVLADKFKCRVSALSSFCRLIKPSTGEAAQNVTP